MNKQKCEDLIEVKAEEEEEVDEKPDIVSCDGPTIDQEHIKEFVYKLQRYEIDKLIEHIDEKVLNGDFFTKMPVKKVIDEIENLATEDPDNFNMKRYAIIYNIIDSFGKTELDIFLQIVESKIENGFETEEDLPENKYYDDEHSPNDNSVEINPMDSFFHCHICFIEFASVEELEQHVEEIHFVTFCCSICDEKFEEKADLQKHIKQVHCVEELGCPGCDNYFHSEEALEAHVLQSHSKRAVNKSCPHCHEKVDCLESHLKEKHKESPKKKVFIGSNIKCVDCHKVFGNVKTLERHSKRFHGGKEHTKVMCDFCNTEVSDIKTHMKSHEEKKFQCEMSKKVQDKI